MANKRVGVMVVDDEALIAWTVAAILQCQGFRVRSFTNPVEALLSAQIEAPDLLVSDVLMPELSGIDLAARLRAVCPDCKILLFSGQAATGSFREDALNAGISQDILAKPVHPLKLLAAIGELGIVAGVA